MSGHELSYRVARPTGRCAATGRPLEPGTTCLATLSERPDDEGLDRRDYCLEAWESGARPEGLFSYWKTTVPHPDARQKVFVDDAVLLDLFERLAGDDRRQRVAYRFILALVLMRKKLLRYVGRTAEGEHERWMLLPKGADTGAEPIEVANPRLTPEDVRELAAQLGEVLRGDL